MIDGGCERRGQFVKRRKQLRRVVHEFLRKRRAARGLGLANLVPELALKFGQLPGQTVQLGHEHCLLGEFDGWQEAKRRADGSHLGIAKTAQIFVDLGVAGGDAVARRDAGDARRIAFEQVLRACDA